MDTKLEVINDESVLECIYHFSYLCGTITYRYHLTWCAFSGDVAIVNGDGWVSHLVGHALRLKIIDRWNEQSKFETLCGLSVCMNRTTNLNVNFRVSTVVVFCLPSPATFFGLVLGGHACTATHCRGSLCIRMAWESQNIRSMVTTKMATYMESGEEKRREVSVGARVETSKQAIIY